jgi:hypothetical protein
MHPAARCADGRIDWLDRLEHVAAHRCARDADAIAELGGEPVDDEHVERFAQARNVRQLRFQFLEVDQLGVGRQQRAEDCALGEVRSVIS